MKSKLLILSIIFCGILCAADLSTKSGKVYRDYEVDKATATGLSIFYESGAAIIPYDDLPANMQKKYEADAEKAIAQDQKQAEKDKLLKAERIKKAEAEKIRQAENDKARRTRQAEAEKIKRAEAEKAKIIEAEKAKYEVVNREMKALKHVTAIQVVENDKSHGVVATYKEIFNKVDLSKNVGDMGFVTNYQANKDFEEIFIIGLDHDTITTDGIISHAQSSGEYFLYVWQIGIQELKLGNRPIRLKKFTVNKDEALKYFTEKTPQK